jgi:hypothetical protein
MVRRASVMGLALVVLASPVARAQAPAPDPEVARGIALVEDGDYDGAIFTLDGAARRLAKDPARAREMAQAYLYLGIAYVGKGHEAAAKAKFREALAGMKDLVLSPEKFPPKVIDLFEAARSEARTTAPATPPAAVAARKGSSGKAVLIGVGALAVGGGVALAAGGGDDGGGTGTSTPVTDTFTGLLTESQSGAQIPLPVVQAAGHWRAELTWTTPETEVRMFVVDAATRDSVAEARLTGPAASIAEWEGTAGRRYEVEVFLQEGGASQANYTLHVTHPR